jgi:hypothetical protein
MWRFKVWKMLTFIDVVLVIVWRQRLALSIDPTGQVSLEDADRIQSPKCHVLNKRQDEGYHQNCDSYSSQTYRSYFGK